MTAKEWPVTFTECCNKYGHQLWYMSGNFRQYTTQCQLCGGYLLATCDDIQENKNRS